MQEIEAKGRIFIKTWTMNFFFGFDLVLKIPACRYRQQLSIFDQTCPSTLTMDSEAIAHSI